MKICVFCGNVTADFACGRCQEYKGLADATECPECGEYTCEDWPCDCEPKKTSPVTANQNKGKDQDLTCPFCEGTGEAYDGDCVCKPWKKNAPSSGPLTQHADPEGKWAIDSPAEMAGEMIDCRRDELDFEEDTI